MELISPTPTVRNTDADAAAVSVEASFGPVERIAFTVLIAKDRKGAAPQRSVAELVVEACRAAQALLDREIQNHTPPAG